MAFQLYDPNPIWRDNSDVPCAGGTLETFEDEACTAPYATFNSSDLDVANPVALTLNASGRAAVEIWSGEPFWIRLSDEDANVVWTREVTSGQEAGTAIPSLTGNSGKLLTNDGTNLIWETRLALPDPTGSAGQVPRVTSDGTAYELYTPDEEPPPPEYDIDFADSYIQIGTYRKQFGTGTVASASGAQKNSVAVTFATPFDSAPVEIGVWNTTPGGSSTYGRVAGLAVSNVTTTGMTVTADVSEDDTQSQHKLNNATTFGWFAGGEYDPA